MSSESERKPFERLPSNVVPRNYNLTLQPALKEFIFSGNEVIDVEVTKATNQVVLNCVDIKISSAKFNAGNVDLTAGEINYSKDDETATLVFPSDLPVGSGNLRLDFTGELNDKMKGFYRSKYVDDGQEKYCAVTQFEVAVKTLPFYKEYFGISYPLPKMDLIAIADFAAGAMENWGLVTYRETALLIDPKNSSSAAKQWVALVVGHEIAHQWFGNLVTMSSNRGKLNTMVPVGHPSEIDEIFDAISYSKGASVIRMLHHYIGDKDFKTGLSQYLNKFKYNNASTEDLWEYLAKASGKPVADIMTSWTKQMGFPVLSVKSQQGEVSPSQYQGEVSPFQYQGEFSPFQYQGEFSPFQYQGEVPPLTRKGNDKELSITQKKFCADGSSEESFSYGWEVVMVNPGQVGFYRVQYESPMLELLLPAIKDLSLPPRDRLGLQSDLYALARAGLVSTTDFLKVVEAYSNEVNYTVWNDMISNLASLALVLQYTDFYKGFGDFCLTLFKPIADKLGWDAKEGEGHLDALLRGLVINRLGKYGDEATVKEAQRRFEAHCKKESTIDADLRSAVYCIVLEHGNEATLDAVEKLFREADLPEERVRLMRCMGKVTQADLIKRVLKFALSDDVRSQDTVFAIAGVTGSVLQRVLQARKRPRKL
ncbi:hypothetical protein QZH41_009395, partial [Actinostola sp. cb2023]